MLDGMSQSGPGIQKIYIPKKKFTFDEEVRTKETEP
jgi:hypothetical protein